MNYRSTVLRIIVFHIFVSFWVILPGHSLAQESMALEVQDIDRLFQEKKYKEVIQILSKKTDSLPSDQLILLGHAYSETENSIAAIKTYTLALNKKEKNFEAKTLIGHEYLNLKKEREALVALREALDFNMKYEPAYQELERLYLRKNNKYELRTLYLDMVQNLGEKPEYLTRLCELSYSSGLYESAIVQCRRGIVLSKEEPKNYVYLALTFKETGKLPEANSLLKRAADNFSKSYDAQMTYANLMEEQKNFIEAQRYFRKATEMNPSSLKATVGFANASVELQKFQEALDIYSKACKINRNALSSIRKSIVSLKGFKATEFIQKFEELADVCGMTP